MSITKILDLIPINLHPQLFEEVAAVMEEKRKKEEEEKERKAKTDVPEMIKLYLAKEHEQREKEKRERINPY